MYIHDVTLEGFKSYGVKAKFEGFNDSKLGFSTAKELLFGHGQDAVTKAIVSLALKSLDQSPSLLAVTREEVAKKAQHLKKEKWLLSVFLCESVLSSLMDDLREVEARIHMLEGEREEWLGKADAFLSKASNLRLQLLHTNEKKKLKIREFNTAKKKKQELHNDLGRLSEKIETMIQNYEWIEGEKDRFGVSGGELDFKSMNFHTAKKEYDKLLANKAARQTVRGISEQIERLQEEGERLEKRATELKFRRNVAALLPGVDAKLEVRPNASIFEGLQVVVYRGVIRQSLSQMPEGSVVALSFLL
uniref:Uncharacterized protein n=1 Tax=Tanacetum cinerariifolium TaxID=118510 RepID=A0A699JHQ9_TANCI|nr:hypothetical protein [Tanacetum cinerariifolium]